MSHLFASVLARQSGGEIAIGFISVVAFLVIGGLVLGHRIPPQKNAHPFEHERWEKEAAEHKAKRHAKRMAKSDWYRYLDSRKRKGL